MNNAKAKKTPGPVTKETFPSRNNNDKRPVNRRIKAGTVSFRIHDWSQSRVAFARVYQTSGSIMVRDKKRYSVLVIRVEETQPADGKAKKKKEENEVK